MKKIIFQDLMVIKQSWSFQLWKYFLVSIVFHCLLIYILVTVPLTTPIARDFPTATEKPSLKITSRESLSTKTAGEPTGMQTGNRLNQSREYPGSYPGISGTRETLYIGNYDTPSREAGSNHAGRDKIIEPFPVTETVYQYQLPVPDRSLDFNSHRYIRLYEKPFRNVRKAPISGLPVKKRTVSYQKVKRFIERKQLPPKELVKIEEMINYFYYDYPLPPETIDALDTRETPAKPDGLEEQEIARVKVTYKFPNDTTTKEVSQKVWEMNNEAENKEPSSNFKFSAAVAEFGMLLLSSSESRMGSTLAALLQLAKDAIGEDQYGYRAEFIKLVEAYQQMTEQKGGQQ
ncbi:MAG: von Willebrand factor type A domain-containing protein [Candidatus Aminicenantes bacterium]|jgi:hypothetical protein